MYYQTNFSVDGLHDPGIAALLKKDLQKLPGVKEVQIGVNQVRVVYDPSLILPDQITANIKHLGIKTRRG